MTDFLSKLYDLLVTNWKTTSIGVIALITSFLSDLGVTLSPGLQDRLSGYVTAFGLFLLGLFAKDAGKKGINENDTFCSLGGRFLYQRKPFAGSLQAKS